jgi:Family of unknown function (DUF6152)
MYIYDCRDWVSAMKGGLLIALALSTLATAAWAHHSYGMFYELDQRLVVTGRVAKVSFGPPHVRLTIETEISGTWEAEWTNPNTLTRQGVGHDTVRIGDFLEIEGSPARDPEWRVVSALREIRRPTDGWRWVRPD